MIDRRDAPPLATAIRSLVEPLARLRSDLAASIKALAGGMEAASSEMARALNVAAWEPAPSRSEAPPQTTDAATR